MARLQLDGFTPSGSAFGTVPSEYRPAANRTGNGRYTNSGATARYPMLITVTAAGAISASYYDNSAHGISNGTCVGDVEWIIGA